MEKFAMVVPQDFPYAWMSMGSIPFCPDVDVYVTVMSPTCMPPRGVMVLLRPWSPMLQNKNRSLGMVRGMVAVPPRGMAAGVTEIFVIAGVWEHGPVSSWM